MKGTAVQTIGILVATLIVAAVLLWPRLAQAKLWRASITPLASIIGSGFLLLGPILAQSYGLWAPVAMAALCGMAYAIGAAVRYNITALERGAHGSVTAQLETLASWALSFAYIISVAYYLNLLGAFAVSLTPWDTALAGRCVTSAVFAVILIVGWTKGFQTLERLEQVSVGLKLAIIGGLLFGLGWFLPLARSQMPWSLRPPPKRAGRAQACCLGFWSPCRGLRPLAIWGRIMMLKPVCALCASRSGCRPLSI